VDIPQVAARVIAAQRPTAESDGSTLVMNFPDEFPAVEADSDKIEQILTNLVGNAVKYSPAGGEITVAGVVDVSTNVVMIRVTDHGIGIPREHIGRVFERFYRVDNSRDTPGTGIGLYLVKTLSEAHHGNVRVVSEPGRGTTFTVTLPMKQPRPEYSAST
jgi:signal transduction histidine kinase